VLTTFLKPGGMPIVFVVFLQKEKKNKSFFFLVIEMHDKLQTGFFFLLLPVFFRVECS
jgi:hypothetical protein